MELKIIAGFMLNKDKYTNIFWRPHVKFDECEECHNDRWCTSICDKVLWKWIDILSIHESFVVEDDSIQSKFDEMERISSKIRCILTRNSWYGPFDWKIPPDMDVEAFCKYFLCQFSVPKADVNLRQVMGMIAYMHYNKVKNTSS
jgi:hypothetical protein